MENRQLRTEWASPDAIPQPERQTIDVFYDAQRKEYWVRNSRGIWIMVTLETVRMRLRAAGFWGARRPSERLSEVDEEILRIQDECDIAYAGPLAGYPMGLHEVCGHRVLVTSEAKLIEPKAGEHPLIDKVLENLFVQGNCDQRAIFLSWLKIAIAALRSRNQCPGQALCIAGPRDCGKSFVQNYIVTPCLGGRIGKPYLYMIGETTFNSDLFGAEHLMIEDEFASTAISARRQFGASIKEFTVNQAQMCHGKNKQAITLTPFWRVTVTLNEEPEHLLILPPLDESLRDKIILLKAFKKPMPMPTASLEQRAAFSKALLAEIPAFLHFLEQWRIPEHLVCQRFGVKAFQHPELVNELEELAPEMKLLSLIDSHFYQIGEDGKFVMVCGNDGVIRRRAEDLEAQLCDPNFGTSYQAKKLLDWNNATGTYLGRLAEKRPDRVQRARTAGAREWIIYPPKLPMTP